MENQSDKKWQTDLKVLYFADYKEISALKAIFTSDRLSLALVTSGTVRFTSSIHSFTLSAGSISPVPSGFDVCSLSSTLQACLVSCPIDFAFSNRTLRLGSACIGALTSRSPFVLPLTSSEMKHMLSLFSLLKKKISTANTFFQEELVLLCYNLLLYEYCGLYYKYGQHFGLVECRSDKSVMNFIALVQQHCKEHREIKFYADALFVSQGHLSKIVRNVIGMSAKHFVETAVISEAYLLLADEKLSITDVAESLSFKDPSSFSHFFKRHSKLSPTQYRLDLKPE